jgi:hypothetical protein
VPCLVIREFHGFGVESESVPLFLPAFHENLNFLFGFLSIGIKVGDPRMFQFRLEIGEQGNPMFPGTIMGICVEYDSNTIQSFVAKAFQLEGA